MDKILVYECPYHVDCYWCNDIWRYYWDNRTELSVKHCPFGRQVCKTMIYPDKCPTEALIKSLVNPAELFERLIGDKEASDILNNWRYDLVLKEIEARNSCSNCVHQEVCKYTDAYNTFIDSMTKICDDAEASDIFDVFPVCKLFVKIKENVR